MDAQACSENLCEKLSVSEVRIEADSGNVRPNEPMVGHPRNENLNSALALAGPVAAQSEQPSPNCIPTDFLEFPNGTLAELARGPAGLALLVWSEENGASIVEQFEHDGRLLIPPAVDEKLSKILRLPEGVKSCPTAEQLFVEICEVLRSYVDLHEKSISLVAAFALSTWFVDRLVVAPYLWICGHQAAGRRHSCGCCTVCAAAPC